jgi:glycosyltransferase involved in cell wall biosynthesis
MNSADGAKEPVICHISNFQPEYGGSFIDSLLALSQHCWCSYRIRTVCIFPHRAKDRAWIKKFDDQGVLYGFVPRRKNISRDVQAILQGYNPIILHSHFFLFDLSAIIIKIRFYRNLKIVWHYHSQPSPALRQKIKNLFKLGLIFGIWGDRCIAVGDGVFRTLQHVGLSEAKSVLIHNSADTSRFIPNREVRSSARQFLKASQGSTVFLLLGYSPLIKGVDIFVKAAAEALVGAMPGNGLAKLFVIVGRHETKDFVSQLPGASQLGDALLVIDPVEDFSFLLNGVDVLVSASRSEGFGYAVIEAMAAEKLVLCSDIDPVRETYGRSKGVWLFPAEDWRSLSLLMTKSDALPERERNSLGRINSLYVRDNYSMKVWIERIGRLYQDLLGK